MQDEVKLFDFEIEAFGYEQCKHDGFGEGYFPSGRNQDG
jgi:hypothetical protein